MCETVYKYKVNPTANEPDTIQCCTPAARESHAQACAALYFDVSGRAPLACGGNLANNENQCAGVSSLQVGKYKLVYSSMDASCVYHRAPCCDSAPVCFSSLLATLVFFLLTQPPPRAPCHPPV